MGEEKYLSRRARMAGLVIHLEPCPHPAGLVLGELLKLFLIPGAQAQHGILVPLRAGNWICAGGIDRDFPLQFVDRRHVLGVGGFHELDPLNSGHILACLVSSAILCVPDSSNTAAAS